MLSYHRLFPYFDLPVSGVSVQYRKSYHRFQAVDAFIQVKEELCILYSDCVYRLEVVAEKSVPCFLGANRTGDF